jgi:hypothetical protein
MQAIKWVRANYIDPTAFIKQVWHFPASANEAMEI